MESQLFESTRILQFKSTPLLKSSRHLIEPMKRPCKGGCKERLFRKKRTLNIKTQQSVQVKDAGARYTSKYGT